MSPMNLEQILPEAEEFLSFPYVTRQTSCKVNTHPIAQEMERLREVIRNTAGKLGLDPGL